MNSIATADDGVFEDGFKIGDHLTNIAQAVIGGLQWEGVEVKVSPSAQTDSEQNQSQ